MHVYKIRIGIDFQYIAPDMLCELQTGNHPVFVEHQVLKNIKFLFC
jgi:hypothetical protein